MNWDVMQGKWKQIEGDARSQWGKFTDDEWHQVGGDFEKFVGKIQEKYGVSREEAERRAKAWADTHGQAANTTNPSSNQGSHTNPER